ncbi:putative methylase [Violaceomyces palustris]|uniref:Methylase n=1 Tax=Violaceomyces palustris TaxID=1673888 RepID=A0ACD0P301_9BASI|nr:putative methylase [Violaceomyces palustris]
MIPTPSLSHLTKEDYRKVYEPAEDTFALLDALEEDAERITSQKVNRAPDSSGKGKLCVEIGSGSGCVSAFVSQILGSSDAYYICTDINPEANRCTDLTGKENKVTLNAIRTSLLESLTGRLENKVDLLLFNPPYVPTEEEEERMAQAEQSIQGSWAGGNTGTRLVDTIIDQGLVETLLSPGGSFYLVAIKQNDPEAIVARLNQRGLDSKVVLARRAGREHLHIIRSIKPTGEDDHQ